MKGPGRRMRHAGERTGLERRWIGGGGGGIRSGCMGGGCIRRGTWACPVSCSTTWCPLESSRMFVACASLITLASFFSMMAAKFTALDVHDLLDEDDEFSLLEGADSDDEDVAVCGYLPEVALEVEKNLSSRTL